MSDTPETDSQSEVDEHGIESCDASFARRLERERNLAQRELNEAGWTYQEGAARWRPPVNRKIGKLWQRVFTLEDENYALRQTVAELIIVAEDLISGNICKGIAQKFITKSKAEKP